MLVFIILLNFFLWVNQPEKVWISDLNFKLEYTLFYVCVCKRCCVTLLFIIFEINIFLACAHPWLKRYTNIWLFFNFNIWKCWSVVVISLAEVTCFSRKIILELSALPLDNSSTYGQHIYYNCLKMGVHLAI